MMGDYNKKTIWDLSLEEIEDVFANRHMNNYVYVAFKNYHLNTFPAGQPIKLNEDIVPAIMLEEAQNLCQLIPYIGTEDSFAVRTNYLFRSYFLFEKLREVDEVNLNQTIDFLAHMALFSTTIEKNDKILIWPYLIARPIDDNLERRFELLKQPEHNLNDFAGELLDKNLPNDQVLLKYIHTSVSTLLTLIENGLSDEIGNAFNNVEKNMFRFEKELGFVKGENLSENFNHGTQIRWRGTLYLYGGNFFEQQQDYNKAYNWYLRGINTSKLLDHFTYYLTAFKAVERLICAYRVGEHLNVDQNLLYEFINAALIGAFEKTGVYAGKVLNFIRNNPDSDLKSKVLSNDETQLQYAGESVREVYLISLLYKTVVNKQKFEDLKYDDYFIKG